MRRVWLAALLAAGSVMVADPSVGAVIYQETGLLQEGTGEPAFFQAGGAGPGSRSFRSYIATPGSYHYELVLPPDSFEFGPDAELLVATFYDDFYGDEHISGSDDDSMGSAPIGTFYETPTGYAGDFTVSAPRIEDHGPIEWRGRTVELTRVYQDFGWAWVLGDTSPAAGGRSYTFTISAAPEPAMWMLAVVGFFGVGAAIRRRRAAFA